MVELAEDHPFYLHQRSTLPEKKPDKTTQDDTKATLIN